jgi:hypothetical protein
LDGSFSRGEARTVRKRKTFLVGALALLLIAGIVAGLILMIQHEPGFYARAAIAPGKARREMSATCFGKFFTLKNNWQTGRHGEWDVIFEEAQLNSYFEEGFIHHGLAEVLRQQGMTDPRVAMENDKLRLAFRYNGLPWSTIISYDLKLWLAPKEVNVICIEFLARHAGALPIATQSLLNEISDVAGRNGFEVTWYRHEGNPVALLRIQQSDRSQAPAQLRRLEVKQGWMSIGGLSEDPNLTQNAKHVTAPVGN